MSVSASARTGGLQWFRLEGRSTAFCLGSGEVNGGGVDEAMSGAVVKRESCKVRLDRLKKGCRVAWAANWAAMFITCEAALIWLFLSVRSTNRQIAGFLLLTVPVAALVAWLAMLAVGAMAPKLMVSRSCEGMNEVTDGVVWDVVKEMSIAARLNPAPRVFVADTDAVNAYAMSDGKEYCVVLTRPLLQRVDREELKGVVGHEIGHIVTEDCQVMTKLVALTSTVSLVAGVATDFMGGRSSGGDSDRGVNPLAIALLLVSFVLLLAAPLLSVVARQFMSRERESQADATSVHLTRNPNALARALLAIQEASTRSDGGVDRLQSATSRKFYKTVGDMAFWGPSSAMASHPPTVDRVRALVSMGADPGYATAAEQVDAG